MFIFEQITVYLEQRIYKELRSEQYGFAKVVMLIYRRLLVSCKDQMLVFLFICLFSHVTEFHEIICKDEHHPGDVH